MCPAGLTFRKSSEYFIGFIIIFNGVPDGTDFEKIIRSENFIGFIIIFIGVTGGTDFGESQVKKKSRLIFSLLYIIKFGAVRAFYIFCIYFPTSA